jgi:hypothetical protein
MRPTYLATIRAIKPVDAFWLGLVVGLLLGSATGLIVGSLG